MRAICLTLILMLKVAIHFGQAPEYVCLYEAVDITTLASINSASVEFSPVYYGSGIVYVKAREKSKLFDQSGRAYFDLMYADIGPDGMPIKGVNFSPNIRTQYHEGPCTFSADGREMFFTRSNLIGGTGVQDLKGKVQLRIYGATKGPDDWENIQPLPFTSDMYATMHPALSHDGRHMVFVSDMPGGYGGMDLYVVSRGANGQWGEPENLGSQINTPGNEVFPWWHPEGYLFFSSDGRKGKGGLDLYVTFPDTNEGFSVVQHLSAPFNSSKDDLGLIVSPDGTTGYFASARKPGKGKDDLYFWQSPRSIFCNPPQPYQPPQMDLLVIDDNGNPLPDVAVWLIPMGAEGPLRYSEHFKPDVVQGGSDEGTFYLKWNIVDTLSAETADAHTNLQGNAKVAPDERLTYVMVVRHHRYQPHVEVVDGSNLPDLIMLHAPAAKAETPMCFNTRFTLYNASGDLVLNGAQVTLRGKCFPEPLILYTDENGNAVRCLPSDCSIKADFEQPGYAGHSFTFTPSEDGEHWKIYLSSGEGPAAPISTGTVIVLDNIYYDFNKSEIRKSDAGELAALADILKQYPALTIELTSHTDTRGTADYNMELSARRSASAKEFLVSLGISADRITTKAAGESSPRNHCLDGVNCTEEEHQRNRRTEVRITNPVQGLEVRYKE